MKSEISIRVAVLMTCYNRVKKTLKCLDNLSSSAIPDNITLDIFLVDDNSPDQTGKIVKENFPHINTIMGNGSLYWNRGMRFAWKHARRHSDYDFYLWVNDDVYIEKNAIENIFSDYYYILKNGIEAVISGVCYDADSDIITYGGRDSNYNLLIPNGVPQICKYINGNFVLIPKNVFHKIGYLSYRYIHSAGDHDYGLRAIKSGFKCYVSSFKLAVCLHNDEDDKINTCKSLRDRIRNLFSVKKRGSRDYFFLVLEDYGVKAAFKLIVNQIWNFVIAIFYNLKIICKIK
jgi:GT2 family glycosyltransferase